MDKAKAAITDFMGRAGKHDTTVHETVAPAVVNETVKPTRHEEIITATDREVHQDHYHTSVQPVQDRQVLPEQHTHNLVPVEHRHHEHGNDADVKRRLAAEAAQFKDTTNVAATQQTQSVLPTVAGEHIHHHVHETIQPVVHKETIQPTVVHTTIPIHEVHHNAAQHHSASALPAMSMQDFKKQGGVLSGREERYDGFEGQPKNIGNALGSNFGTHGHGTTGAVAGAGATGAVGSGLHRRRSSSSSSSSSDRDGLRSSRKTGTGITGTGNPLTGSHGSHGLTGSHTGTGLTGSSHTGTGLTGSSHTGTGLTGSSHTGTGLPGTGNTGSGGLTGTNRTGTTNTNTGLNSNVPGTGL